VLTSPGIVRVAEDDAPRVIQLSPSAGPDTRQNFPDDPNNRGNHETYDEQFHRAHPLVK